MAEWTWDLMDHYRLEKGVVNDFLVGIFGPYDFELEVRPAQQRGNGAAKKAIG